jgi:hypothetical protein
MVNIKCGIGYNEFDFLNKMKNPDHVLSAKLKSKTHSKYFDCKWEGNCPKKLKTFFIDIS